MPDHTSFKDYTIVSCGTLRPELKFLREQGFLDADRILYTTPGLHEHPRELEKQLTRQLSHARNYSRRIIVVYGSRCYVDPLDPFRSIDRLIQEQGEGIRRVKAANCIDMLADAEQRDRISGGEKVYWLSPGWFMYWRQIFEEWDVGLANETFPKNDKALLLDALGFFDAYVQDHPENVLEFSDWMRIPIEAHEISLERLKSLLSQQVRSC